jgi:putative transposase
VARIARASAGCVCYHVLNRGNARAEVFHKNEDFVVFLGLIEEATEPLPMRLLAWCLIPNHFHLVLWPHKDGDLSRAHAGGKKLLLFRLLPAYPRQVLV